MKRLLSTALVAGMLISPSAMAKSPDTPTLEKAFEVTIEGVTHSVTLNELGVIGEQRQVAFFLPFASLAFITDLFQGEQMDYHWETETVEDALRAKWGLEAPKNAEFVYDGEVLNIASHVDGVTFDLEPSMKRILRDAPRLKKYEIETLDSNVLTDEALSDRREQVESLLNEGLNITVRHNTYNFPAQMKDLHVENHGYYAGLTFDGPFLDYVLDTLEESANLNVENLIITDADLSQVTHASTQGRVQDGLTLDRELTGMRIQDAANQGKSEVIGITNVESGTVINMSGTDLGKLEKIATGASNFEGSTPGRDFNVRKALNEHYNSILIPEGGTFSFNSFLGPVTYSEGWAGSLAIFAGTELRKVPGGGVCQVSTTIYRAALDAGLNIIEQHEHSLYVHYYDTESSYDGVQGAGLDSTIFPGIKDLIFENNTGAPILIEAFDDGNQAVVNFYGENDGRITELDGPYTQSNQTEEVIEASEGGLTAHEIAWKYSITWPDGSQEDKWIIASYNKYAVPQQ